jgi:gamma-glutamylcyclotransferase (GGCT)/AIG2-like uncharacterized protein YtfP
MIDRLFTYGTLEIPSVVKRVLGRDLVGEPAVLRGYARFLVRGECHPGIAERAGASVSGTVYNGMSPAMFLRLDRYEGEEYQKRIVEVILSTGEARTAYTYTCLAGMLSEAPWDRDIFIRDHLQDFLTARGPYLE